MKFTTPIQQNKWIDNFLIENKLSISLYNFKTDNTTNSKSIKIAFERMFAQRLDLELSIQNIEKTWYSKTIPLDVGSEIVDLLLKLKSKGKIK